MSYQYINEEKSYDYINKFGSNNEHKTAPIHDKIFQQISNKENFLYLTLKNL